ncbi:hypothetical protein VIGAN_02106900 [Vigna angularis var. angularis]|uniref:Uncharacterized protein n=1 Tax=Vigna angularis var. angularis TaxID=157739 RepID=A0A0S3RD28_PHAAN|nr:hypothetical protein VIGAN_02106900 [Vigna angularis var. angularis]
MGVLLHDFFRAGTSVFQICFTASSFPLESVTLYTFPEPPFPIRFSCLMESRISPSEKLNTWNDFTSQDSSFKERSPNLSPSSFLLFSCK